MFERRVSIYDELNGVLRDNNAGDADIVDLKVVELHRMMAEPLTPIVKGSPTRDAARRGPHRGSQNRCAAAGTARIEGAHGRPLR